MSGHVGVDGMDLDAVEINAVDMGDIKMGDLELNGIDLDAIQRGTRLAPGEAVVWQGSPSWRSAARDVFHMRGLALYFLLLFGLDAYQAWSKHIPTAKAVHDSVPLLVISVFALTIVGTIAWFSSRTTRYIVTQRRVILHYGIAMPATLALPLTQIVGASVSLRRDHTGDVALVLKAGNHMPFLKLWPLARAWHITRPQPMLRGVPQAAVVAGLVVRALRAAEHRRAATRTGSTIQEKVLELLSA